MERRSVLRLLAGFPALGLVAACQGSAPPLETAALGEPQVYQLGPGDKLRVIVFGEEQLSGEFAVDGSGRIALPLIGEVRAAGLSARELEETIATRLADGYLRNPRVSVEVMTFRPFYIIGEVNNPGQYPYVSGMTARQAVAMAGGYTYRGRKDYVLITRGSDPEKIERRAPVTAPVYPDDVVRVPERFF